ncbi:MAG: tyrosine-protein phosphatase [Oscillospiraceae bacterium]|nr:tyrosine-protein phosphatase [Oscillospiraceae bacterium]
MRKLPFRELVNFRDLGGYKGADGRPIKEGLIYRSGGLYLLNDEELRRFHELKVAFVLDLRSKGEVAAQPDPELPGVQMLQHSGLNHKSGAEIDFSPAGMARVGGEGEEQLRQFLGYYEELPLENDSFQILLQEMCRLSAPILFHCASGKDRTGVAAMLVLYLLGVDPETIMEDYMLSNDFLRENIARELDSRADIVEKDPAAKTLSLMKEGVVPEAGGSALKAILNAAPDAVSFFEKEYGISADELRRIRDFYLE